MTSTGWAVADDSFRRASEEDMFEPCVSVRRDHDQICAGIPGGLYDLVVGTADTQTVSTRTPLLALASSRKVIQELLHFLACRKNGIWRKVWRVAGKDADRIGIDRLHHMEEEHVTTKLVGQTQRVPERLVRLFGKIRRHEDLFRPQRSGGEIYERRLQR